MHYHANRLLLYRYLLLAHSSDVQQNQEFSKGETNMPEKVTYLEIKPLKTTRITRNSFGICVTAVTPKPGPTSTGDTRCWWGSPSAAWGAGPHRLPQKGHGRAQRPRGGRRSPAGPPARSCPCPVPGFGRDPQRAGLQNRPVTCNCLFLPPSTE